MQGIHAHLQLDRAGFQLDVQLDLPGEGITALFGPSGCGKTTILRSIAGLEAGTRGSVIINGAVWQDEHQRIPPHQRALGYVFQEASLFLTCPCAAIWTTDASARVARGRPILIF